VKVLNSSGSGYSSWIANGVAYAADSGVYYGKRTVINLSLGGTYSSAIADAVSYAQSRGVGSGIACRRVGRIVCRREAA
jgi:subtilisin family serine protease